MTYRVLTFSAAFEMGECPVDDCPGIAGTYGFHHHHQYPRTACAEGCCVRGGDPDDYPVYEARSTVRPMFEIVDDYDTEFPDEFDSGYRPATDEMINQWARRIEREFIEALRAEIEPDGKVARMRRHRERMRRQRVLKRLARVSRAMR